MHPCRQFLFLQFAGKCICLHIETQKQQETNPTTLHDPRKPSLLSQYFVISPPTSITNCSRFGIGSLSFLSMSWGVPRCPQDPESLYLLHQDWDAGNLLLLELVLEPIPEVFNRLRSGEFRGHPDLGDSREQDQEQDTDSEEHWRLGGHRTDGDL